MFRRLACVRLCLVTPAAVKRSAHTGLIPQPATRKTILKRALAQNPQAERLLVPELSKALQCSEETCRQSITQRYPEILLKPAEDVLLSVNYLLTIFDRATVIRCCALLARHPSTVKNQLSVLEEIGFTRVGAENIVIFDFIVDRTIDQLKNDDGLIPKNVDVLEHIVEYGLRETPLELRQELIRVLPAKTIILEPIRGIWAKITGQYIIKSLQIENLKRVPPQVFMQSLRRTREVVHLLQNTFKLDLQIIQKTPSLLRADLSNLHAIAERVDHLCGFSVSELAFKEPNILRMNVDNMCIVESILRANDVTSQQVWAYPQIYSIPSAILAERLEIMKKSAEYLSMRSDAKYLVQLAQGWMTSQCPETGQPIQVRDTLTAPVPTRPHRLDDFLLVYICSKLGITNAAEKTKLGKDLRQHHRAPECTAATCMKTIAYLFDELQFSRKQILEAPELVLYCDQTLRNAWSKLKLRTYMKEIGTNEAEWKEARYVAEMLLYEVECDHRLRATASDFEIVRGFKKANPSIYISSWLTQHEDLKLLADEDDDAWQSSYESSDKPPPEEVDDDNDDAPHNMNDERPSPRADGAATVTDQRPTANIGTTTTAENPPATIRRREAAISTQAETETIKCN